MPIAYYPTFLRYHLPGTTDFNFFHFWWRTLTVGPWPSGPAWFLWVLLALDIVAAALWALAPRAIESVRPADLFAARAAADGIRRLSDGLGRGVSADAADFRRCQLAGAGGYPLPIQTSRILLYAGYFLTGVGIGVVSLRAGILGEAGELAKRWPAWLAFALVFYGAILLLVYARHNWIADFNSRRCGGEPAMALPLRCSAPRWRLRCCRYPCASRSTGMRLLDAMRPSAYGIFLTHYIFIIWLQYAVYDYAWPAVVSRDRLRRDAFAELDARRCSRETCPIVCRRAGVPGYAAEAWYGLYAPAKTPPEIIDRLNKSAAKAVQSEAFRKLGANEGLVMVAAPPEALDRYFRDRGESAGAR